MMVTAKSLADTTEFPLEDTGKSFCDAARHAQFHLGTRIEPFIESLFQKGPSLIAIRASEVLTQFLNSTRRTRQQSLWFKTATPR